MRFSVIVPLYNKAPYIVNTVKSILAQTFEDFEVIVVDDGSTDGGADLVGALHDDRIQLVRQTNAGVSVARNHGIRLARGSWIAFLDADDWHHPQYLATLVGVQKAYPEADTVAAGHIAMAHAPGPWPALWPEVDASPDVELIDDLPHRWMLGPSIFTSAIAVKTHRLQSMQPCFPVGESRGEDLDVWFRLGEKSPIALAHTPLVAYRLGSEGSLTSTHRKVTVEPQFLQRFRARAGSGELTASQSRSLLRLVAQFNVSFGRESLEAGDRLGALRWLIKGYRAAVSKRWWATAVIASFFPARVVRTIGAVQKAQHQPIVQTQVPGLQSLPSRLAAR